MRFGSNRQSERGVRWGNADDGESERAKECDVRVRRGFSVLGSPVNDDGGSARPGATLKM
jgi:hypothetical protein